MKGEFIKKLNRKQLNAFIILVAVAAAMLITTHYPWYYFILFAGLLYLILSVKLEISSKGAWPWIWTVVLYVLGPVFSIFCIQYTILEPEDFVRTKQHIWHLNYLCAAVIYLLVLAIAASVRWAWIISHGIFLLAGFVDYFVYQFRGNEVQFSDIQTIGTGLKVAKEYKFSLHDRGALVLMMSILAVMMVWKFRIGFGRKWVRHVVLRAAAVVLMLYCSNYLQHHAFGLATQTWETKGTRVNGFILNFVLNYQDSKIDPPVNYSTDAIRQLEDEYSTSAETETKKETESRSGSDTSSAGSARDRQKRLAQEVNSGKVQPTIITIMDESFADFRKIGDLNTNIEVTPVIDSLQENTTRGCALSSVFGAKTPNSEWEYMTGNSMAFLPSGSVVYEQYLDQQPSSIVSTLKNEGYKAIAMHPYYSTGWRRNTVYPRLGFDEMYFYDGEGTGSIFDGTKILREYITDEEMFEKLIDKYKENMENDPDTPLFIMGITMQNHGGYKDTYDNFTNTVHYQGGYYPDADQYLSCIHATDSAVETLINYFSSVDKPVEIIFFGDHYPSLDNGFFRSLNGKGTSGLTLAGLEDLFSVPFFIWHNYDTEEKTIDRTSLNYLSTMALEDANIDLPPYNQFLADMMEAVPAINSRGYMDANGSFAHTDSATGEAAGWIEKYNDLEYNGMFDEDNKSSVFFPYLDTEGETEAETAAGQ